MLEERKYTKAEMTAILGTRSRQGIERKLKRYNVDFESQGSGANVIFTINKIPDPFKLYCITELGFDGRTDFTKLLYFLYYFFNDIEFMAMPDEVKEARTEEQGRKIARQTIAGYTAKLDRKNLIDRNTNNFIYYFAIKKTQRIVEKEEYLQAWHEHWDRRKNGMDNYPSIMQMFADYGGVARKQPVPEINGICTEQIEYLNTLIQQSMEKEMENQN